MIYCAFAKARLILSPKVYCGRVVPQPLPRKVHGIGHFFELDMEFSNRILHPVYRQ